MDGVLYITCWDMHVRWGWLRIFQVCVAVQLGGAVYVSGATSLTMAASIVQSNEVPVSFDGASGGEHCAIRLIQRSNSCYGLIGS